MTPKTIVAPIDEPISVADCRAHLEAQRYDDSDVDAVDDAMIEGWLSAAREYCEDFLGLSLATRTLEIALDRWPTVKLDGGTAIELPMGPVRELVSIIVGDETTSSTSDGELDPALYTLDTYRQPARVVPVSAWPAVTTATNTIKIRYLAGYGVDSDGGEAVPKVIRAAMLLILGHLYANREDATAAALHSIPTGAEALMRPRRILKGMA